MTICDVSTLVAVMPLKVIAQLDLALGSRYQTHWERLKNIQTENIQRIGIVTHISTISS